MAVIKSTIAKKIQLKNSGKRIFKKMAVTKSTIAEKNATEKQREKIFKQNGGEKINKNGGKKFN